jgi:signal transduction histidine kinase
MAVKQLRYRTRLIIILSLFAIVPAALLTLLWSGTASSVISLVSGRAAWESAAASGQKAIAAIRTEPLTAQQRALVDAHERELSESLEQARRYSFLANRSMRIVIALGLFSLLLFGFLGLRAAGHLSRQMSRPLDEIVRWTGLIGRGEQLPPKSAQPARGAPEFAILRDHMHDMADAIEAGKKREAEAERLRAYRESARRVAHELKNPLTPIRFAIARLKRDAPPELRETIDVLETESERLERIARSFAQFGRLPEGPAAEIDIEELLTYAAASAIPEGIEANVAADPDLPRVVGHHDALAGAVSNIILNAVDACDGKGKIDVLAHRHRLNGTDAVSIEIRDTGHGVAPQDLERIWDPYVTGKAGGTGLGLAIARQTVLAHDGRVEAESVLGSGTIIRLIIPAAAGATERSANVRGS